MELVSLELRLVKWIVGAALAGAGLVIAAVWLFGGQPYIPVFGA